MQNEIEKHIPMAQITYNLTLIYVTHPVRQIHLFAATPTP